MLLDLEENEDNEPDKELKEPDKELKEPDKELKEILEPKVTESATTEAKELAKSPAAPLINHIIAKYDISQEPMGSMAPTIH
jgi:hypothetical protein